MSRTKQQDHGFEFFPTERAVVHALLECPELELSGGIWIDPCAGSGRIIEATRERRDDVSWFVCELDPRFDGMLSRVLDAERDHQEPYQDFVSAPWNLPRAKVAIFNPPFSHTTDFVEAAMERAETVICLQRQAWFGSQKRAGWLREHCPDTYDLPWRPSFRPDGKTDNCEYSWYVWPNGEFNRRSGRRMMLDAPDNRQREIFGE